MTYGGRPAVIAIDVRIEAPGDAEKYARQVRLAIARLGIDAEVTVIDPGEPKR